VNTKGFSLLENLIAAIVLMLIIFGMMGIFLAGRQHIAHSRSLVAAAELGRYYLTPLQMQVRQDQWDWTENCLGMKDKDKCESDLLLQPQNINGIIYTPHYAVSDAPPGITTVRKVKLTISWDEPN
jgi:hypothetical protein